MKNAKYPQRPRKPGAYNINEEATEAFIWTEEGWSPQVCLQRQDMNEAAFRAFVLAVAAMALRSKTTTRK